MSHPVPRDDPKLGAVLQEHVASRLLGTDSDTIIGDNCTRGWWHLELLGRELQDSCERSRLRDTQSGRMVVMIWLVGLLGHRLG